MGLFSSNTTEKTKKKTELEVLVPISSKINLKLFFSFEKDRWNEDPLKIYTNKRVGRIQTLVGEIMEVKKEKAEERDKITNPEDLIRIKNQLIQYISTKLHEEIEGAFELQEITMVFK